MGLGQRVRAWFGGGPSTFADPAPVRFMAPVLPVDQLLLYAEQRAGRITIDRPGALGVPAVLRGRNLICSVSTLPLRLVDADNRVVDHPLFRQIDSNTANTVMLAMTLEDLVFESVAWWRVTAFTADGYPAKAVRYTPGTVSLQPPAGYQKGYLPSHLPLEGVVYMEGKPVPFSQVIRFDSPNPGLLLSGARAIRRAIALDEAADMYATNRRMRGFFAPSDDTVDPADDDAIEDMLNEFAAAREKRLDGYVPAALKYTPIQDPTPAEIQIIAQQNRVDLQIANALGLDPEDLGINTTSRTYQNATDRRRDRVNDTLAPYMSAITDRLSMPDVTKRGYTARFILDDYLKADPKTRAEVQQIYSTLGVTDAAEIREEEGKPPRAITPPAAAPTAAALEPRRVPSTTGDPVQSLTAQLTPATFDHLGLTFDMATTAEFAVDVETRTITGLAVPWNQVAVSNGKRYRFARGAVKWSSVKRVKLLRDHVNSSALGKAINFEDTEQGLVAKFKVSAGRAGDEALALAFDEVLDGLSIGVDMLNADMRPDPQNPGVILVTRAALREVSLTAVPSFDDSRLTSVRAASEEGSGMNCPTCGAEITPGVAHTCAAPPATTTPPTESAAGAYTFSADQFATFLEQMRGGAPAEGRPVVDPSATLVPAAAAAGPAAQVAEALPYEFSYSGGRHTFAADAKNDFSTDLFTLLKQEPGAVEAEKRINALIKAQFEVAHAQTAMFARALFADVERADVTDVTVPHRYRPDMWQAQRDYVTPLWDMVAAGTTDGTKFDIPKFTSSSGLVGPATEKTEPAGGAFVAELQTITPTQVWGKVEITRQAWRAGGNPALSGILWSQMLREYAEDREAAVATFLATLTAAADITLTGRPATTPDNDDDQVTAGDFDAAIADLQFVRGGNRFRAFAVHQDLYRLFARVTDDAGRKLFPMINPQNANGTAAPLYRTMDISGTTAVPAWALGAGGQTTAQNSWLFDPAVVLGWASAPERLFWDFGATVQTANIPQLSFVTLGIYGDVAMGNTDITGVRQVIFDPSV